MIYNYLRPFWYPDGIRTSVRLFGESRLLFVLFHRNVSAASDVRALVFYVHAVKGDNSENISQALSRKRMVPLRLGQFGFCYNHRSSGASCLFRRNGMRRQYCKLVVHRNKFLK